MRQSKSTKSETPSDTDAHLQLQSYLPYRFSIIAERMSRHLAAQYVERFGIKRHEWRVLHILSEGQTMSTQDVIQRTSLDRLRVSRAAIRLEDKGMIARVADPRDQRAHLLQLSAKGRRIYSEIVPIAQGFQTHLAGGLTPEELRQLDIILNKLNRRLDKIPQPD